MFFRAPWVEEKKTIVTPVLRLTLIRMVFPYKTTFIVRQTHSTANKVTNVNQPTNKLERKNIQTTEHETNKYIQICHC